MRDILFEVSLTNNSKKKNSLGKRTNKIMLGKLNCQISFQGYTHIIFFLCAVFNLPWCLIFPSSQTTSTVGVLLQNLIKKTGWNILLEVGSNKALEKLIRIMTKSFQRLSQVV